LGSREDELAGSTVEGWGIGFDTVPPTAPFTGCGAARGGLGAHDAAGLLSRIPCGACPSA